MPLKMNIGGGGGWNRVIPWMNVSGTWKKVAVWQNVSGTWKKISGLLSVSLPTDITASDFQFYPTAGYAEVSIQSGGNWTATNDVGGTWLVDGTAEECEVRLSYISGVTPSGPALGSWHVLNTTRLWSVSVAAGGGSNIFAGTLDIREAATGTILDSASVTIEATSEF